MSTDISRPTGWKPVPFALKGLSVVMLLWAIGSAMNLPNPMENGLPVLGTFVFGTGAFLWSSFWISLGPRCSFVLFGTENLGV